MNFCQFYANLCSFFRVFLHVFLIYLAQTTQIDIATPIINPKTRIAPKISKKNLKKPNFL